MRFCAGLTGLIFNGKSQHELLALLLITVFAAYVDFGPLHIPVAITIAVLKALLIVLFFMHVGYSSRLTRAFVGAGFFWLLLLTILTMSDFATRGWLSATLP